MNKLLMLDDDREVLEINRKNFTERGYTVFCAETAARAFAVLNAEKIDCVLLDVMMPGLDGFEVCRRIRENSQVPVLFLTGKVSEDDKVNGLMLGADDYIEKPYSFRELEARVQASIRRNGASSEGRLSFPPLEIDIAGNRAFIGKEDLGLSRQEYVILHMLCVNNGKTVTYEQIGLGIWEHYRDEDRSTVMVAVSRLRKKLENNPVTARMIETVWTHGYRFTGKKKEGPANEKNPL